MLETTPTSQVWKPAQRRWLLRIRFELSLPWCRAPWSASLSTLRIDQIQCPRLPDPGTAESWDTELASFSKTLHPIMTDVVFYIKGFSINLVKRLFSTFFTHSCHLRNSVAMILSPNIFASDLHHTFENTVEIITNAWVHCVGENFSMFPQTQIAIDEWNSSTLRSFENKTRRKYMGAWVC